MTNGILLMLMRKLCKVEINLVMHNMQLNVIYYLDTRNAKGCNFAIKCKLCNRENTLDVIEGSQGNERNGNVIDIMQNFFS